MVAGELNDQGDGFRYPVVVLSVPRRAGKSTLVLAAALDRMDLTADARCWYTCANGREVAAKLFRDEWCPMLEPLSRLYRLRKSQGSEGVHKRRGSSRVQLFAPTPTALHSANVDTAIVDEAFAASLEEGDGIESGITPAQLTRPWRQLWIVSAGGTIDSTWLDAWLTAGEQAATGVALFDYGADAAAPDYDPGDPAVWARSHPTAGVAFPLEVLQAEWDRRRDDAAFERAYLNVWPRPSLLKAAGGVDLDLWRARARPDLAPSPITALAVDVAADRSAAAIAAAGFTANGWAVEVLEHRPGVAWVAAAIRTHRRPGMAVVADSIVAASILSELNRARVRGLEPIGVADHARACGIFTDRLIDGTLTHRAQAALDDAVTSAARRPMGDGWLWSRRHSRGDICPLVAVTLAAWAADRGRVPKKASIATVPTPPGGNARTRTPTRPGFAAPRPK